ncbi:zwei Ig domain protein zig-8-like [Palaemon carinicauda]|uniref:zwei Ig domain protein zig-8-like n=1 Tax=Palaemon carinicauda TaxID=392227 RepID=UPI0035B6748F
MFHFLYFLGALSMSATGGPSEVDRAYPLDGQKKLTPLDFPSLTEDEDEQEPDDWREETSTKDYNVSAEEERGGEEPYFDASMSPTYTAYLGKTATLTCIVHATKSDKSVSWIRGRDLRILTVGRYTYTTDFRFEALHQEASAEWTLRIKSVERRDQGSYECQITTKPIRTFNVFLKVVEPTVEILGAPDIFVNRASMINLTCIVRHAPFPPKTITWYHGNKVMSYISPRGGVSVVEERGETTTSFLLLQNAHPTDSGIFSCHPENMQPATVTLHVLNGEKPAAIAANSSSVHCQPSQISAIMMFVFIAKCVIT